jgi:nucleotide-binding universal stress UspA family protein
MIPTPTLPLTTILCCTDFSDSARFAFEFALDTTARHPGAALHLVHVIHEADAHFWKNYLDDVNHLESQTRAVIHQKLNADYLQHLPAARQPIVHLRTGPAAPAILECAHSIHARLIVLGHHGHTRVTEAIFGGVAAKVVRQSPIPVLVIPLPR